MKDIDEIRRDNLRRIEQESGGPAAAAKLLSMSPAQFANLRDGAKDSKTGRPRGMRKETARRIENAAGKSAGWLDVDHEQQPLNRRASDFKLHSADETDIETSSIELWDAKGSCGGGFLNYEQLPKGHLVKENTFFSKYGLKPENAFAIYADGNSMAEFIVDGDIVIFDRSKKEPRSGKIFAIDHPDGLRIKVLRREIDGTWVLESKNPDKRTYPDERIPPDHAELLKICGEFVYRQGG